jgi:hypothetical protein
VKSLWYRRGVVLTAVSIAALATSGAVSPSAGSAVSAQAATGFGFTGGLQTYTVPTDGSVCSLTIDAAGANGGSSTNVAIGATGIGGTGGHVTATFAVSPGDTATVAVGGVGADSSGGTAGGAGAFGGGAPGGSSSGLGHGAAGGGGATTVQINGVTELVAGAGGGGGVSIIGAQGGAGGNSGSDGSAGIGGAGTGLPPHGAGGLGGTTATGGTGGTSGGGTAGAGGDGLSGTGGSGGNAAVDSGAGGGGGGGFFGGGGGGGADATGAGGGGGGGAGFAAPNATGVGAGTLVQDGAGNGQALITPAAGDCAILTVQKAVQGAVPAGTTFTVHVSCSHEEVTGVTAQAIVPTINRDLIFDAAGQPTAGTIPTLAALPNDSCSVTETGSGNAVTVAYGCSDTHTTGSALCQTSGRDVIYGDGLGQRATVTVTNTFANAVIAPVTSPLVTITPKFTG